jgi:hypothetical protein
MFDGERRTANGRPYGHIDENGVGTAIGRPKVKRIFGGYKNI